MNYSLRGEAYFFFFLSPENKTLGWCFAFWARWRLAFTDSGSVCSYVYILAFNSHSALVMYGRSQYGPNHLAAQAAAALLLWRKRLITAFSLPVPVLALQSDVRPNDFTYLMQCHRLEGNRRPLLTLCTACSSCPLTEDLNDAARGIPSCALGLSACHFLKRPALCFLGLNLKSTLADVHLLRLE